MLHKISGKGQKIISDFRLEMSILILNQQSLPKTNGYAENNPIHNSSRKDFIGSKQQARVKIEPSTYHHEGFICCPYFVVYSVRNIGLFGSVSGAEQNGG